LFVSYAVEGAARLISGSSPHNRQAAITVLSSLRHPLIRQRHAGRARRLHERAGRLVVAGSGTFGRSTAEWTSTATARFTPPSP